MIEQRTEIRLALPSKGRLAEEALDLLNAAGLRVYKPNPRQYRATIPSLPGLTVLFQRPGDIVVSVREGSVDFGITGWDVFCEKREDTRDIVVLQPELGFGSCTLNVIVPETMESIDTMADLAAWSAGLKRPLRVASKFPALTEAFFQKHGLDEVSLISAEGTLETAPAIGYADLISDLVSSGQTLKDNRLRQLSGGTILLSQAALIANRKVLNGSPQVLAVARHLLEYIEAHLRAEENVAIFANIRGETPELIAEQLFAQATIGGLQGPTISRVMVREGDGMWFAVHIIVRRETLFQAVAELRSIGGSGVVVTPVTYIFEEEPPRYKAMLAALENEHAAAL